MSDDPHATAYRLPLKRPATAAALRGGADGFVGRARELETLSQLLLDETASVRWLSVVGAAGIGRTRLVRRLVADWLAAFPAGAGWVDVALVPHAALLPGAVAHALGVREQPGQPLTDALAAALARARVLLVLDGCDGMRGAVAALIARLLPACPYLAVAITAAEPLQGMGEIVWRVPALARPDSAAGPRAIVQSDAPRWFIDRAARRGFTLPANRKSAVTVAQICRRLDGIALAIEFVAARAPDWPLAVLAAGIDERFQDLPRGSLASALRAQTLRAALDWSYGLLVPAERLLLDRLSVWGGGWELDGVTALCPDFPGGSAALVGALERLADWALLTVEVEHGVRRWRMLEPVRDEVFERLRQSGDVDAVVRRAADFYVELAERLERQSRGSEHGEALSRARRELPNLRAALAWAAGARECVEFGLRMAGALDWFWQVEGLCGEVRYWADALLRVGDAAPTPGRAKTLRAAGNAALAQADLAAAARLLDRSADQSRQLADPAGETLTLVALGRVAAASGDATAARSRLNDALSRARAAGLLWETSVAQLALGHLLAAARPAEAEDAYLESAAGFRQCGDAIGRASALTGLAALLVARGDYACASMCLAESLAVRETLDLALPMADTLSLLAQLACAQGDHSRAATTCADAATLLYECGARNDLARVRRAEGEARLGAGDRARAGDCFRESLSLLASLNDRQAIAVTLAALAGAVEPRRAIVLGAAAGAILDAAGSRLDPATEDALRQRLAAARAEVGDDGYQSAWRTGRGLTLADALALAAST